MSYARNFDASPVSNIDNGFSKEAVMSPSRQFRPRLLLVSLLCISVAQAESSEAAQSGDSVIDKTGNAIAKGAKATANGVEFVVEKTVNGIKHGANATTNAMNRGGHATGKALGKAADKVGVGGGQGKSGDAAAPADSGGEKP
jgi:phage-related protein